MKCQHCGHAETAVLETRSTLGASVIRRTRGCGQCGGRFSTYEIDGGIWGTVKKWALGSHLPALEKRHARAQRDQQIVAMINSGRPLKEIAAHFNLAESTVIYAARKAGVQGRRGPQRGQKPKAAAPRKKTVKPQQEVKALTHWVGGNPFAGLMR